MSREVFVSAIGIAAPGLDGWQAARSVLRGNAAYAVSEQAPYQPKLLPSNERRRAPATVRLAFRAAEDALAQTSLDAATLATVFASSDADMDIIHRICSALCAQPPLVSPTDFHNSVHNAAAGYWGIAAAARGPSTTIGAFDATFAAGLQEAYAQVLAEGVDTLLVAYDAPPPHPISAKRDVRTAFSTALVLSPVPRANCLGPLRLDMVPSRAGLSALPDPALEALRLSNAAARSLPLLRQLALGAGAPVRLETACGDLLQIEVAP